MVPLSKSNTQINWGSSFLLGLEMKANLWPSGDQPGCVSLRESLEGSHDHVGNKLGLLPSDWMSQISKSCPPARIFEEKAIALWGIASVDTSVHVIVGTGGDETRTGVEVGEEIVGVEVVGRDEAVGMRGGVEVGEEVAEWTEGSTVPPASTGTEIGVGLAAQATRNILAAANKVSPSKGLLTSSMVEAFHMSISYKATVAH